MKEENRYSESSEKKQEEISICERVQEDESSNLKCEKR